MMTKTELFAELNDKENRVNATAHIAVYKYGNGNTSVIVSQQGAPNICLSNHKSDTNTAAAVAKYTTWLNEWVAAQAEAAQPEAIEINESSNEQLINVMHANFFGGMDYATRRDAVEAAHAEALEMNNAYLLAKQTGFSVEACAAELEAEEGDYFAVMARLRSITDEAVAINEAYSAQIAFDCHMPSYKATMISWAHQEALDLNRAMDIAAVNAARARNFASTPAAQQYVEWLAKARHNGTKLVAWNCPACATELHSLYPAKCGEVWDSATVCPMCGHLYFKITRRSEEGTGHVQLKAL